MSDDGKDYDQETITKAFEEALDDVHTRFILNLPPEELSSTDRIFFQLEQAWYVRAGYTASSLDCYDGDRKSCLKPLEMNLHSLTLYANILISRQQVVL